MRQTKKGEAVIDPFRKAGKLAAKVGLRWHVGSWPNHVRGKGHAADDVDDLCHEIGHYLVSPKWLRNRKHFGLGHPLARVVLVSSNYAYELERQASILGIVLARECGQSLADAQDTADEHSWRGSLSDADWQTPVGGLSAKGLWSDKRQQAWRDIVSDT